MRVCPENTLGCSVSQPAESRARTLENTQRNTSSRLYSKCKFAVYKTKGGPSLALIIQHIIKEQIAIIGQICKGQKSKHVRFH